ARAQLVRIRHREIGMAIVFRMIAIVPRWRHALASVEADNIDLYARETRYSFRDAAHAHEALAGGDTELDCGDPRDAERRRRIRRLEYAERIWSTLEPVIRDPAAQRPEGAGQGSAEDHMQRCVERPIKAVLPGPASGC